MREGEGLLAHEGTAARFLSRPALEVAAEDTAAATHGLMPGQQLGAYTIVSLLGSGGMAKSTAPTINV